MAKFYEILSSLRKRAGLSQQELSDRTGIGRSAISMYETGRREPDLKTFEIFADFYKVDMNTLTGQSAIETPAPRIAENVVAFPVLGSVAAGYDHMTDANWSGEQAFVPREYLHGRDESDYFMLRVEGDSMYPLYQNGDLVLVLRQTTLNRSGDIGVVIYDDDKATLKKVEYVMGEDWMRMVPINPLYSPTMIENEALEHCRVLGIPKLLIREL